MKIGVIYCAKGQSNPQKMFRNGLGLHYRPCLCLTSDPNQPCHPRFWEFMNFLGTEINLENWQAYRGDMGRKGRSYYDRYQDIEGVHLLINFSQY